MVRFMRYIRNGLGTYLAIEKHQLQDRQDISVRKKVLKIIDKIFANSKTRILASVDLTKIPENLKLYS